MANHDIRREPSFGFCGEAALPIGGRHDFAGPVSFATPRRLPRSSRSSPRTRSAPSSARSTPPTSAASCGCGSSSPTRASDAAIALRRSASTPARARCSCTTPIVSRPQLDMVDGIPFMTWDETAGWTLDTMLARVRAFGIRIPAEYALLDRRAHRGVPRARVSAPRPTAGRRLTASSGRDSSPSRTTRPCASAASASPTPSSPLSHAPRCWPRSARTSPPKSAASGSRARTPTSTRSGRS